MVGLRHTPLTFWLDDLQYSLLLYTGLYVMAADSQQGQVYLDTPYLCKD